MVTTDLALLADAYERLGQLHNETVREGLSPATDSDERVRLARAQLRAEVARDAIFDVLVACEVNLKVQQATPVLDRILKGRE